VARRSHRAGRFALVLGWLFAAIAGCAFGVARHAESLAERVGEPLGTLSGRRYRASA